MADLPKFFGGRWVRSLTLKSIPAQYRKQWRISPAQLKEKYPDLVTTLDERGSKAAAHQWWHDLMAEVRAKTVVAEPDIRELMARCEKKPNLKDLKKIRSILEIKLAPAFQVWDKLQIDGDPTPLQSTVLESLQDAALADELSFGPVVTENKFSSWRDKWLAVKKSELKPSSYISIPYHIAIFGEHVGIDSDVTTIGEEVVESFKFLLASRVDVEISTTYAHNICTSVKSFLGYLFKMRKIEQPRNIKDLSFKTQQHVNPLEIDVAKRLIADSSGILRCWLLLMFNCAYIQSDLSELKPSEIDWKTGRIIRKRTKEKDEKRVPTVNYLLWPETFNLLKEYGARSGQLVFRHGEKPLIDGRNDVVSREFGKLRDRLGLEVTPKQIRKTVATMLSADYRPYVDYYGGWSPTSIPDKAYIVPPQEVLDSMSLYLREKLIG